MANKRKKPELIYLYTDGSCDYRTKAGGWAFVALKDGRVIDTFSGAVSGTTNNRMELWAVIMALDYARREYPGLRPFIYTDSTYVRNMPNWVPVWRSRQWQTRNGEPVKNLDLVLLMQHLVASGEQRPRAVLQWVRGHGVDAYNCFADDLARESAKSQTAVADSSGAEWLTVEDISQIVDEADMAHVLAFLEYEDLQARQDVLTAVQEERIICANVTH